MASRARLIFFAALACLLISAPLYGAQFLFSWQASSEEDLVAYGIYQSTENSSYILIDEVRVEDLDDPVHPTYLVAGLNDGTTYQFAATSISGSGSESDFFSQTCIVVNGQIVECSDNDQNGTTVFISCFIGSLSARP